MTYPPDPSGFLSRNEKGDLMFDGVAYAEAKIDAWVLWATHTHMEQIELTLAGTHRRDPVGKCRIDLDLLHEDTRHDLKELWDGAAANDLR